MDYDTWKTNAPEPETECDDCDCLPSEQSKECYQFGGCGCHKDGAYPKDGEICPDCSREFRINPQGQAICGCSSSSDSLMESFRRLKKLGDEG